jgi:hypothetical protein
MPTQWTPRLVDAHLKDAVEQYVAARGSSTEMPSFVQAQADAEDAVHQALCWLQWLDGSEQRLVWDRASGMTWKLISHSLHIDRSTAWRRWSYAIIKIVAHLNANNAAALLQHQDGLTSKHDGVD